MKLRCISAVALLLLLAVYSTHAAESAPTPVPAVRNAALVYWQAFAELPRITGTNDVLLNTKPKDPLDQASAKKLSNECFYSLDLATKASLMPQCDWGMDLTLGTAVSMPQMTREINVAKLLRLRARVRLQEGDPAGATADLLTILRMSRHASEPPMLIGLLVQRSMETIALLTVLQELPKFDEASLKTLRNGIEGLPPARLMKEGIVMEQSCVGGWLHRKIKEAMATNDTKELRQLFATAEAVSNSSVPDHNPAKEAVEKAAPKTFLTWMNDVDQAYDELIAITGLPYAEYKTKMADFETKINALKAANPLVVLISCLTNVRERDFRVEAGYAVLKAAIDAQLTHPDDVRAQLAKIPDPFGNGPMECHDVPTGVELRSKLKSDQKQPVTLVVGIKGCALP